MAWKIDFKPDAIADLDVIYEYLRDAYLDRGSSSEEAILKAERRVSNIVASTGSLARTPYQGTRRPELDARLRNVTFNRAILYFTVNDDTASVSIQAIFFGGQDHINHMLKRLKGRGAD